jgi:hypothetical protein
MWQYLLQSTYWTRIWIVQEVFLAKQVVFLIPDGTTIPWTDMLHLSTIHRNGNRANYLLYAKSHWNTIASSGQSFAPLKWLLETFLRFQSTKREDKVFALLALANPGMGIEIDYRRSIPQIAEDTCIALLKEHSQYFSSQQIPPSGPDSYSDLVHRTLKTNAWGLDDECSDEYLPIDEEYHDQGQNEFLDSDSKDDTPPPRSRVPQRPPPLPPPIGAQAQHTFQDEYPKKFVVKFNLDVEVNRMIMVMTITQMMTPTTLTTMIARTTATESSTFTRNRERRLLQKMNPQKLKNSVRSQAPTQFPDAVASQVLNLASS